MQGRIVNGEVPRKGELPYVVRIIRSHGGSLVCTGSLIKIDFVLTAAHCMTDYWITGYIKNHFQLEGLVVVAGSVNVDYKNEVRKDVLPSSIIIHPGHIVKPKKTIEIKEFCAPGYCVKKGLLRNPAYGIWSKNLKYKSLFQYIILYIKFK